MSFLRDELVPHRWNLHARPLGAPAPSRFVFAARCRHGPGCEGAQLSPGGVCRRAARPVAPRPCEPCPPGGLLAVPLPGVAANGCPSTSIHRSLTAGFSLGVIFHIANCRNTGRTPDCILPQGAPATGGRVALAAQGGLGRGHPLRLRSGLRQAGVRDGKLGLRSQATPSWTMRFHPNSGPQVRMQRPASSHSIQ